MRIVSSTDRIQPANLKVLVLGSGGREHALLQACLASPLVRECIAAPGNGGMAGEARCLPLDVSDVSATVALARSEQIDLVIVGPEGPLALGAADALRAAGIATFGPGKDGAALEASKAVCKAFFQRHSIPTAAWQRFDSAAPAVAYLQQCTYPVVIKASGLAAGKGVLICDDRAAAVAAIEDMLLHKRFGDSGSEIVIEEFLDGEEASLMVLLDGQRYVCMPPSQDHKRIGEKDTGPNTGGMGAYAPAAVLSDDLLQQVRHDIIEPTLAGFHDENIDFRGVLFIGLMIHNGRAKVLEYNVRFGDPECQVLLPLCASDPVQLLFDCAHGQLDPASFTTRDASAMIVVLAANGYPDAYPKGSPIGLPPSLPAGVSILHAGTSRDDDGTIRANGGRVLGVTAVADSLENAAANAYSVADAIQWQDKYFRRDIGHRQLRHPPESVS
jgi:phosphoribosylamine--glycine ligase